MAKEYSFDVVSSVDRQEVSNAVNQASREIATRYDFKGSKSSVTLEDDAVTMIGDDDFKLRLVREIINGKLAKRGVSLKNVKERAAEPAAGGTVRQVLDIQTGISKELGKEIQKKIKTSGLKVTAQIQDDQVRISGKDKDVLQEVISLLKGQDFPVELQFVNYR